MFPLRVAGARDQCCRFFATEIGHAWLGRDSSVVVRRMPGLESNSSGARSLSFERVDKAAEKAGQTHPLGYAEPERLLPFLRGCPEDLTARLGDLHKPVKRPTRAARRRIEQHLNGSFAAAGEVNPAYVARFRAAIFSKLKPTAFNSN